MSKFKQSLIALSIITLLSACNSLESTEASGEQGTIIINDANFSHAETARMYRNWIAKGHANEQFAILPTLPPRGDKAPTVQMNDDTLYGVAVLNVVDGKVTFDIPETNNYFSVQVVTENGHGEHLIVEDGVHTLPVTDTETVFLIYRSGVEIGTNTVEGIANALAQLKKVDTSKFDFATDFTLPNYDFTEVEAEVNKRKAVVDQIVERDGVFTYTFPRTPAEITDLTQWNLENAAGWGGASPIVLEGNKYVNSPFIDGDKCETTTFEDPQNRFFTSVTAYDSEKYLIEGAVAINSYSWEVNADKTVTISFNCGDDAINNIDTSAYGKDFTITTRHYGATQAVIDSKFDIIIKEIK
ncbi:DUF1254 domain-containing protein [Colwellia demingiae]|uniref:DUF1254 domain-containing protein n=1 Tax=Colwellia demingiae TaxID=89401 RepID=A0A5C6QL86_9GAMM|nr:DUF1254 domain-containing protein [Colwellia demingiae]TWX69601.1 DUF1254 domain-containing protein [Colwellia demingiae]